jgi:hypothetical protein
MSDASRELRGILDRRDPQLESYLKALRDDFKPNSDGSVTFSPRTFATLAKLRRRSQVIVRRIEAVHGASKPKRALLAAFGEIDEGFVQFRSAAQIGYSQEQVAALQKATAKLNRGVTRVKKVRKGLPK